MPQISKWSPAVVEMKMKNAYRYLYKQTMIARGTRPNDKWEMDINPELAEYYKNGTNAFLELLQKLY
jgi:hypothetical protein